MREATEKDYKAARAAAEKIFWPNHSGGGEYIWFVNSDRGIGYGYIGDRFNWAYAKGRMRREAVQKAIDGGFRAGQHNW